jgi:hypothetical protein
MLHWFFGEPFNQNVKEREKIKKFQLTKASLVFSLMRVRETPMGRYNTRETIRENLLACFRDEETYGFLKENKRWQELVKRD